MREQIEKKAANPDFNFNIGSNKQYKVESIKNSTVYIKKTYRTQIPGLY